MTYVDFIVLWYNFRQTLKEQLTICTANFSLSLSVKHMFG